MTRPRVEEFEVAARDCPPVLPRIVTFRDSTQDRRCALFQEMVFGEITRLHTTHALKGVVISAAWIQYPPEQLKIALAATLAHFEEMGIPVILVAPSPRLKFKAPGCLLRNDKTYCGISRSAFEEERSPALRAITSAVEGRRGVVVWDPGAELCDAEMCPAVRDGMYLYTDEAHLSATASRALAEAMRLTLKQLR